MAKQEMVRKPCDPCSTPHNPRKLMQNLQQPRGEPQGLKGKGKERAKDDDEVSLDYSGDKLMEGYHDDNKMEEIDPLDQPGDNDLETMEFDVDREVANCAGLGLRQVQTTHKRTMTNNSSQLDNYIAELYINKICLQCSHGCDCKIFKMKEWLIDSGASEHFTFDINSFVDYEVLKNHLSVKTANSTAVSGPLYPVLSM